MTIDVNNPKPISHSVSPRQARILDDRLTLGLCIRQDLPAETSPRSGRKSLGALGKIEMLNKNTLESQPLSGKALFQIRV
jgi:hypothetical protein